MEMLLTIILIILIIIIISTQLTSTLEQKVGSAGEKNIFWHIEPIFGAHRIFHNLYISKTNGQITEIDLLAIHQSGIYVFESKDYGGWIFGNTSQKYWTKSFKGGLKYRFYNPVWQNSTHIRAIQHHLKKYSNIIYYSYIVFSERCTFKNVAYNQENVYILHLNDLRCSLQNTINNAKQLLSDSDIEALTAFFVSIQNPSEIVKTQHLADVKKSITNCPYCKITLVERHNNKTGEKFYGCINYPRCRYTTKELG